jgi:hypothetical protein
MKIQPLVLAGSLAVGADPSRRDGRPHNRVPAVPMRHRPQPRRVETRKGIATMRWTTIAALALLAWPPLSSGQVPPEKITSLKHATHWVGNSFEGAGENGFGSWVQNGADEIEVTPDGTVFAGVSWDEAGRCAGLYKDGKVNRVLLKELDGRGNESAWGWGTANNAVAASGVHLYVANAGRKLLRFRWTPGDLDSAKFVDEVDTNGEAVGLVARGDRVVVVYKDAIEARRAGDLSLTGRFRFDGAQDAAIAGNGTLWVLAGREIRRLSSAGKDLGAALPGLDRPSSLSIDPMGRLVVCDDGRRQQVLIFDVSAAPRLIGTFGEEGGLRSGTPGQFAPRKLFALRGAGADAQGNLYVAMGFGGAPSGNLVLRSFTPEGTLRWELFSAAFVDTFGFDPDSDGSVVYGRTTIFDLDLARQEPGPVQRPRAITLDVLAGTDDDRIKHGCSVLVRNPRGRRLMFTIGQYGGGYRLFTFDGPDGLVARPAGRVTAEGETWAWDVDDDAGVWHGDAPGRTIRRFAFNGWTNAGEPAYDRDHPESWLWPEDFEVVRRVNYDKSTDSLYLFGYLKGQEIESWGVVGPTARRIDGWLSGKRSVRWTVRDLPVNPKGSDKGTPLTASAVDVAGDYLFVGMVKPDDGKVYTHVLKVADGTYVGSLAPGPEVGGKAGWQDMPYSIQALRRKDGEYLILVEEDFRGKNLLYRWRPDGAPSGL